MEISAYGEFEDADGGGCEVLGFLDGWSVFEKDMIKLLIALEMGVLQVRGGAPCGVGTRLSVLGGQVLRRASLMRMWISNLRFDD